MENKDNKKTYWKDLKEATQTTAKGLGLTWEHFQKSIQSLAKDSDNPTNKSGNSNASKYQSFDETDNSNLGIVTNLYPHETMPIPDNGRYKLHNEIDDCIVCNKCAEVCPVNCIEIDAIRGTEQVGRASDGSPIRFYAAKFDIDMAKCCFCGLCTVVCPTECLTMTKEFDFSETDVSKMNYEFGNLKEQEVKEKQKEWDDFQAEKENQKIVKKPIIKIEIAKEEETKNDLEAIKKPIIKIKKIVSQPKLTQEETGEKLEEKPKLKPIRIKLPQKAVESTQNQQLSAEPKYQNIPSKSDTKKILKTKLPKPTNLSQTENKETKNVSETKPIVKKPTIKIKLIKQKEEEKVDKVETTKKLIDLEKNSDDIDSKT